MPADIRQSTLINLAAVETITLQGWGPLTKGNHLLKKAEKILVFVHKLPIKPADFVILTIGIIVPSLCASDLVAIHKHGNAL